MDIEALFGFLILWVAPVWWHVNECKKKGRNLIVSIILSSLFVSIVWICFIGWLANFSLMNSLFGHFNFWISLPLYILGSLLGCFLMILIIIPFGNAQDTYCKEGKIKFGIKKPKFIKSFFN